MPPSKPASPAEHHHVGGGSTVQPGRAGHGRPVEESALHGARGWFRFALQTRFYASCARVATPPRSRQRRRLRVHPLWPPCLDEPALGRPGEESALRGVCSRFSGLARS